MPATHTRVSRFLYVSAPFWLFLFTYAILIANRDNIRPGDAVWTEHVAASLVYSGDIDLNEYLPVLEQLDYFATVQTHGRYYYLFPVGTPLLTASLLPLSNSLLTLLGHEHLYVHLQSAPVSSPVTLSLHLLHASFFVALTTALLYVIARRKLPWMLAALLALTFAFATSAYSVASRALWQHGPSMLMLTLTVYCFVRAEAEPRWARFAGVPLAYAYIVRPTNSLAVVVFTLLVLLRYRTVLWHFLFGAALVAMPFAIYNLHVYASVFSPYYVLQRLGQSPHFWEALAGHWISPARGLLIFTPVVIFAVVGVGLKLKSRIVTALDMALVLLILLHWLTIASFRHWWGGYSFGPRLFSDMMPLFVLLMLPVFQYLQNAEARPCLRALLGGGFAIAVLFSAFVHHQGATEPATWMWNSEPTAIDNDTSRLWDWSDLQFLRGLNLRQLPGRGAGRLGCQTWRSWDLAVSLHLRAAAGLQGAWQSIYACRAREAPI